ncbi:MAG: diacylglycerol kinase family protein [Gemmatimonadota bacterium]
MPEPTRIILNPASSNGGGKRLGPMLRSRLEQRGIAHEIVLSREAGHVAKLARDAARDGVRRILAVGGDGTIHEIANGLLEAGVPPPAVAILPVGTGNDFYRMIGRPPREGRRGIDAALDTLQHGLPTRFDVGVVRWEGGESYFVNFLGVGVDVEVLRRRARFQWLPGITQYLAALLSAVTRFQPVHLHIDVDDDERIEERALLCAVTVGPSVGGGFMLSPDARPDDGLLDLCLVGRLGALQILRYIPKVIRGKHKDLDEVTLRQFQRLRLATGGAEPMFFQLDGDLRTEAVPWLDIEIRAGALPILMPVPDRAAATGAGAASMRPPAEVEA